MKKSASRKRGGHEKSLLETLDIIEQEPDILRKLKKAQAEIRAGKFITWEKLSKKKAKEAA